MLKPFTFEGRFECGLDAIVEGKVWAYTAVLDHEGHYVARLGVAIANEPGYVPIPSWWCNSDSYDEMQAHADALNAERHLDPRRAAEIVCTTMGRSARRA